MNPFARSSPRALRSPLASAVPSDAVSGGAGAPAARPAAGAAPPSGLSGVLGQALRTSFSGVAELAFRNATRTDLEAVARRMVDIDRDKAHQAVAVLAFAAAGAEVEVRFPVPGELAWFLNADHAALEAFAVELASRDWCRAMELGALLAEHAERMRVEAAEIRRADGRFENDFGRRPATT